ncbi:hypothetical protein GF345_03410 [Candidatus Woesearchaeota archaeon]|nr:hypothetical protein [Candidatus Woesearchaeota archaeon]
MEESFLLKTAVVCSIMGVIALYIIAGRIDAGETDINRITNGQADGEVVVKGKVSRITDKEDFMIIEIEKKETIPVFVFKDDYSVNVREGQSVEVRGEVEEYNREKEIVAYELRVV